MNREGRQEDPRRLTLEMMLVWSEEVLRQVGRQADSRDSEKTEKQVFRNDLKCIQIKLGIRNDARWGIYSGNQVGGTRSMFYVRENTFEGETICPVLVM